MFDIIIPFLMGIVLVGAMMERTLTVIQGNISRTAVLSILISSVYWFNIQYVASGNVAAYISFSIGTLIVTCWQSWREKQRYAGQPGKSRRMTDKLKNIKKE